MARRFTLILIILILIGSMTAQTIRADASLVVNTTADEDNTGAACSLREAIVAANTNANYGGCIGNGGYGNDTITFDSGVFATAQTITLASALPDITSGMTISGPGANLLTISGNNLYRPFTINNATVTLAAMTVTRGKASDGGNISAVGGTLTLDHMVITLGQASFGGGISSPVGSLNILDTVVSGNTATGLGGGLKTGADEFDHNVIKINGSTFSSNSAGIGGGIANYGTFNGDNLIVTNSTFSGNTASDRGGGFWQWFGSATFVNVTMSDNTSGNGADIFDEVGYGPVTVRNSIIANSIGQACVGADVTFDHTLVEDGSCGVTNGVNGNLTGDPWLKALANNGGATQTRGLYSISPAIDAGNNSYLSEATIGFDFNGDGDTSDTLTTDQRGSSYARTVFNAVDMGAYENTLQFSGLMVDTSSDSNLLDCSDQPNDCSLRGAVNLANTLTGNETITFEPTVFNTPQTITLNSALSDISSMTISGPGANLLTISGNNLYRPFTINNANVTLSGMTVTRGKAGYGGNLYAAGGTVTLEGMIISQGQADNGGGIFHDFGQMIVRDTVVSGNSATTWGGGLLNGGDEFSPSVLKVSGSTFSGNSAGNGGGIANYGTPNDDNVVITNSTFSGNTATSQGGGFWQFVGNATLVNLTVSGNSAADGAGIFDQSGLGWTHVMNSIVGDNSGGQECAGGSVTFSHSLLRDGSCGFTSGVNGNLTGDPLLSALGDNGSSTQTIAIPDISPAYNAGDSSYLSEATVGFDFNGDGDTGDTLTTDQRGSGFGRIQFSTVDMGAFETASTFSGLLVDTTSDGNFNTCTNQPNDCSLRGALNRANLMAGTDTITFDPTVFNIPQTISLSQRLPDITTNMTITGPGANLLTISGDNTVRPFYVTGATGVTISDLTVTQGYADFGGAIDLNDGMLTLKNMVVTNNHATQLGGGIINSNGSDPLASGSLRVVNSTFSGNTAPSGGGIYSQGPVTVSNSTFSDNTANNQGGAIYFNNPGSLQLYSVTINHNGASGGGGVFAAAGTLAMRNSILANSSDGGECLASGTKVIQYTLIRDGGCGIVNGQLGNLTGDPALDPAGLQNNGGPTPTIALQSGSQAANAGDNNSLNEMILQVDLNADGDLSDILDTDQRGVGYDRLNNSTVDLGAYELFSAFSGLVVDSISDDSLTGCSILRNDCSLRGAFTLANAMPGDDTITFDTTVFNTAKTITLGTVLPNIASNMGITGTSANLLTISGNHLNNRIFTIDSGVTATLQNLTLSNSNDGAIANSGNLTILNTVIKGNSSANVGGAINSDGTGNLHVVNSSLSGNVAQLGGGINNSGTAIVVNSTISGNASTSQGGAIFNAGTLTLVNNTVSNNVSSSSFGGIENFGTLNLYNSIVANNRVTGSSAGDPTMDLDCSNQVALPGAFSSFHSLIADGSCGITNGVNGNLTGTAALAPLGNYGGVTLTQGLLSISPAINAGDNSYLSEATLNLDYNGDGDTTDTLDTDGRGAGYNRVINSAVDIGAYEAATPTATNASSAPTINYSASSIIRLTWNQVTWATGYQVQISKTNGFTTLECGGTLTASADALSISTCPLTSGTYYWHVRAVPASGTSGWSSTITVVIAGP